jgi:hypothetical protein
MTPNQTAIPWGNVGGYCFPLGVIIAVDMTGYPTDFSQPLLDNKTRRITLYLMHSVSHTFKLEQADEFFKWWTELSTPKQVQGILGIIRPN